MSPAKTKQRRGRSDANQPAKRGRPPSPNRMLHTAVVLPREVVQRLKEAGKASGTGLSEQVRLRLQLAELVTQGEEEQEVLRRLQALVLRGPPEDPKTKGLLCAIRVISQSLARDLTTQWHENPYVHAAFKAAILDCLKRYGPDEEADPDGAMWTERGPPEAVGRTHARMIVLGRDAVWYSGDEQDEVVLHVPWGEED